MQRCLKQISLDDLEDQNEMLSTQVILCRVSYIDPRNINIAKDNNEMGLSYEVKILNFVIMRFEDKT